MEFAPAASRKTLLVVGANSRQRQPTNKYRGNNHFIDVKSNAPAFSEEQMYPPVAEK